MYVCPRVLKVTPNFTCEIARRLLNKMMRYWNFIGNEQVLLDFRSPNIFRRADKPLRHPPTQARRITGVDGVA
jgi:hypothetical protein